MPILLVEDGVDVCVIGTKDNRGGGMIIAEVVGSENRGGVTLCKEHVTEN